MLSDFLALEIYFGSPASANYVEDIVMRYGRRSVMDAIERGDLCCRKINLGPDSGRLIASLTQEGRMKAHRELHAGNLAF